MIVFEERVGDDPETIRKIRASRQGNRYNFTFTTTTGSVVYTVTRQEARAVITNLEALLAVIAPTSHIALIDGTDEILLPQNYLSLYRGFYQRFIA